MKPYGQWTDSGNYQVKDADTDEIVMTILISNGELRRRMVNPGSRYAFMKFIADTMFITDHPIEALSLDERLDKQAAMIRDSRDEWEKGPKNEDGHR